MSVLIRGMEMPKDGTYSIVHIYSDGHVSMPLWGKGMQIVSGITAIPVPEHGDLIDKDATMNAILEERGEDTACWFAGIVNDMPAIVPSDKAEEGEHGDA